MKQYPNNDYFKFSKYLHIDEIISLGIHLREGFLEGAYGNLTDKFGNLQEIHCSFTGGRPFIYNVRTKHMVFIGGRGIPAMYNTLNQEFKQRQALPKHKTLDALLDSPDYHVSPDLNLREHNLAYNLIEDTEADDLNDLVNLITANGLEGTYVEDDPTGSTYLFSVTESKNQYHIRHLQDSSRLPLVISNPRYLLPILGKNIIEKCHGFSYERWKYLEHQMAKDD
ncbi:MAG: hypothetical protein AABX52_01740 [Nanoarchaeota archaeon]